MERAVAAGRPRRSSALPTAVALLLFAVYVATLAPGVTFWDAGEFIAAVQTLGVPHPPGTPLYVLAARVWSDVLGFLPRPSATNLFSAACTAAAAGCTAHWLEGATGSGWSSVAAALCAGSASTVWLNATETEVYAASLLLSWLTLLAADRAGRTGQGRWLVLTSYAIVLAIPLHMSALVAAPAAVVLAAERPTARAARADSAGTASGRWSALRDRYDLAVATTLTAATLLAVGAGTVSGPILALAAAVFVLAAWLRPRGRRRVLLGVLGASLLALSALAILRGQAVHDPPLNEGNPVSFPALLDVVARRQYGVHTLWPRQAPAWLQFANLFEYLDWQWALVLAPGVAPSPARTAVTLVFAALGLHGAAAHRRRDRRTWAALVVLFLGASVGLVIYMNFKAGASFGYPIVPDDALHEARDRDYFFALAIWTWGVWAGYGAVTLAARRGPRWAPVGALVAVLPVALNWHAVDRRSGPDAELARTVAAALLWSVPPQGVMVAGGDNDSFPLWYLQQVEGIRGDVTVVTGPLLGAEWYRAELARRYGLLDSGTVHAWIGEEATLVRVGAGATHHHRPFAVALTAGWRARLIPAHWRTLHGAVWVASPPDTHPWSAALGARVDTTAAAAFVARFGSGRPEPARDQIDPAPRVMRRLLACPARALVLARAGGTPRVPDSLDTRCRFQ